MGCNTSCKQVQTETDILQFSLLNNIKFQVQAALVALEVRVMVSNVNEVNKPPASLSFSLHIFVLKDYW